MDDFKCKFHAALAVGLLVYLNISTELPINIVTILSAALGSFLPDADTIHSTLGKLNPLNWFGLMKHRGASHSLLALVFITAVAYFVLGVNFGIGLGYGYALHLAMDALTPMHLPMWNWYPGRGKR